MRNSKMTSYPATKMPGTHHRVEVNGIRMHFTVAGTGEPVVLLHGFPMTSYYWRNVIPGLAERYTVIAPDLRGCGGDCRKIGGAKVGWVFSRLFFDQGWMRGLDVEVGENRSRGRGAVHGRHGDPPAR